MNVVYYRMVNGYGYVPCTGSVPLTNPVAAQPQAAIGNGFGSMAGSGQGLGMLGGQQALMPTPATNPMGMPTALGTNPLATTPLANGASSFMPKWMLPNFSSTQIQYMFRPRMTKTKTSKPVRCETCNITLNSEQQAKQHFTGKSHLKKLRQLNAPADEKEKKKSAGGESSEKKKSEKGDGKKIDGDDDGESSSEKPCSNSTDDAVSSSVSKMKKNAASSSEKCTTTAAPPAGVTETASSESSTRAVSTNQSGKDTCAILGSDTTATTTTTTTKSITTIVHLESTSSSSPLQTPSDKADSESSKPDEAGSLSPDHSSKEQSNSSSSLHQFPTTTTRQSDQSSLQQKNAAKTSSRDRYRRQTSSSPSDSTRQQWRGNAGWGKTNTWGGYRSNGDVDVAHSKPPFANFLMRSMMQLQHQYQTYGAAARLPDRSSLLAIDGATQDIANSSPPCMSLSPPVQQYASQPYAPSATALVPYTPNLINPTTASGLLTPSLMSASTGLPAMYPTSAGTLPTAQGMAMLGYSNGLTGGLYAGNAINGLSMYYKTEPSSLPATVDPTGGGGCNGLLSNGLSTFLGSELTYHNGAAAVADCVYNGHQGAAQTNDTTMYYQSSTTGETAASNGVHHSMLYQNSVSIPGGSIEHSTTGQSSSSNDDPVSKAVMDNIMGRLARKRKTEVSCDICDVTFSSDWQATEHFRGARHTKRAKSTDRDVQEQHKQTASLKRSFHFCHFCQVSLNSLQQLELHRQGQMHRATVQRKHAEQGLASKGPGWQEVSGYKMGWLHCKPCDISVPTSSQLQRHVVSESHRNKQETQLVAMSGHQWGPPAL